MDAWGVLLIWLVWTLIVFMSGVAVHWWMTRQQRRLLKQYRRREQARQWINKTIE